MKKPFYPTLSALLLLATLAPAQAESPAEERARLEAKHAEYDQTYEYYMQVCGVTRYLPKKGEAGGEFGHAVIYLKGACRDESAAYPKLKLCGSEGGGVGVSVDSDYHNVAWTAVSSRSFMFYGDHPADQPISERDVESVIDSAVKQRIFKNVRLYKEHAAKVRKGESYEHYVARWSLGTNFAINLARTAYCTNIPLVPTKGPKDAMVKSVIEYLNQRNATAIAKGGSGFNGITNNCTHLAHNGLAAVGFWKAKETGWDEPVGLGWLSSHVKENISVPFNTMFDAATVGLGDENTFNPSRLGDAETERKGFYRFRWLGSQPGVIVEKMPVHAFKNEAYTTSATPYLLDANAEFWNRLSLGKNNEVIERFNLSMKDARLTDLKTNLKYWQKRYASDARASFQPSGWGGNSYSDLDPALKAYIRLQQADVTAKLKSLEQPAPATK